MAGRLKFLYGIIWLLIVATVGLQILGHKIEFDAFLPLSVLLFVLILGLGGLQTYARRYEDRLSDADREFFTQSRTLYQPARRTIWMVMLVAGMILVLLFVDPFGHDITMAAIKIGLAFLVCVMFVSHSIRCYRAYGRVGLALLPLLTLSLLLAAGIVLFEPWPMWRLWVHVDQSYLLFFLFLGAMGMQSVQRIWEAGLNRPSAA